MSNLPQKVAVAGFCALLAMNCTGHAATSTTTTTTSGGITITTAPQSVPEGSTQTTTVKTTAPATTTIKTTTTGTTTAKTTTDKTAPAKTAQATVAGDAANGETLFKGRCAACHTVTADGAPGFTGPNLRGIVGRKAGTGMGFAYSDAMKMSGITWDPAKLTAYIAAPSMVVPGGKMAFVGPTDPSDQADVVAYLASLK